MKVIHESQGVRVIVDGDKVVYENKHVRMIMDGSNEMWIKNLTPQTKIHITPHPKDQVVTVSHGE